MKNIKLLFALFIISILTLSCSKDDPAPVANNYTPFGYFQGTFNIEDDSLKLIFVFENENKLLVGFNATTLTTSSALLKGTYTVAGNKISGTFINPNAIPVITYNFTGDFDPKTAKYVATFTGTGTNFSNSGTIVLNKVL
jgi:hypothetical protein